MRYCPTCEKWPNVWGTAQLMRYCPTHEACPADEVQPNSAHEVLPDSWGIVQLMRPAQFCLPHEVLSSSWGLPNSAYLMRYCPAHEACPILPTSWATTQLMRNSGLPSVPQTVNCADVTSSNRKGRSVHFGIFWVTGTNKMSTSARHEFQDYRHSTRNKQKLFI